MNLGYAPEIVYDPESAKLDRKPPRIFTLCVSEKQGITYGSDQYIHNEFTLLMLPMYTRDILQLTRHLKKVKGVYQAGRKEKKLSILYNEIIKFYKLTLAHDNTVKPNLLFKYVSQYFEKSLDQVQHFRNMSQSEADTYPQLEDIVLNREFSAYTCGMRLRMIKDEIRHDYAYKFKEDREIRYFYMVLLSNGYIGFGITKNIERRLAQHKLSCIEAGVNMKVVSILQGNNRAVTGFEIVLKSRLTIKSSGVRGFIDEAVRIEDQQILLGLIKDGMGFCCLKRVDDEGYRQYLNCLIESDDLELPDTVQKLYRKMLGFCTPLKSS